jgi:hypothetical protein
MDRIDGAGHVARRFVAEDSGLNRPPTEITEKWLNGVQEEPLGVIEDVGLVPSAADEKQLVKAIKMLFQRSAPISAAASGTVDAITANYLPAITALSDHMLLIVRAGGANTLTNPTFTPNSGAIAAKTIVKGHNQALVAGDISGGGFRAELQYDATLDKWVLLNPANGVAGQFSHGQCRLTLSAGSLKLSPFNGNKLVINGQVQAVPSAGITLAPTGLAATTLYYVYAYMNAGTMTLEASTTGHSTDAPTGVEIKTGDSTRTLVGMAYCKTAATFADVDTQRFVASWFNRVPRRIYNSFTTPRSTSSASTVEINSEIRCEFVCWADESSKATFFGEFYASAAGIYTNAGVGWDGPNIDNYTQSTSTGTAAIPFAVPGNRLLAEGYHYVTGYGSTASGTSTFGNTSGAVCSISGVIG